MSADKFSATLQAAIVNRARAAILAIPKDEPILVERGKDVGKLSESSPLAIQRIRDDTDLGSKGYETLFTRAGLANLAKDFETLVDNVELSQKAAALIGADDTFDAFKAWIIKGITDEKTSTSPTFRYLSGKVGSAEIRAGTNRVDKEKDFVSLTKVNHKDLNKRFIAFLAERGANKELLSYINNNVDAGHLTGVFNIKFQRAFGLTVSQGDIANYRDINVNPGAVSSDAKMLADTFTKILKLLSDADYLSSNIVNDIQLFSSSTKRAYAKQGKAASVVTELQLRSGNQEAGRLLGATGLRINNLIAAVDRNKSRIDQLAGNKAVSNLFNSLKSVADYVEKLGKAYQNQQFSPAVTKTLQDILTDTATIKKLIETEGSDSVVKSIEKTIAANIAGKKVPTEQLTKVKKTTNIKRISTTAKIKTKTIVPKQVKIPNVKNAAARLVAYIPALGNLEALLRDRLYPQIVKNMGTGNSRNVLNFRSGRLARSANIEKVTQSREGMVSVFYSYMRNPYGTFSEGGRQQYPRTRDPKTLISKSIREIGASIAYNRMRAVLV